MNNKPDLNYYSLVVVQLEQICSNSSEVLGHGTGFFCSWKNQKYLVTNHHVVSGYRPGTKEILHPSAAVPGALKASFQGGQRLAYTEIKPFDLKVKQPLFNSKGDPVWLEHPEQGSSCDVVAIPVDYENQPGMCEGAEICAIDLDKEFERESNLEVMDQMFIIGFPMIKEKTYTRYPIYKSGSLASEPYYESKGAMFYVDSKTKKGMSGSLVIKRDGVDFSNIQNGQLRLAKDKTYVAGVYSGRAYSGEDAYTAELGIVWPYKEYLLPILDSYTNDKQV